MKKACILLIALSVAVAVFPACAAGMPEWTYPLEPEILEDMEGYLVLTNRKTLLGADFVPKDLTVITARHIDAIHGDMLRKAANEAVSRMFEAAEADGCKLYLKSVYRAYSTQSYMYNNRMAKVGHDDGVVAYPGSSDHQTGLGMDILNYEWTKKSGMTPAFGATKEAVWMAQHCAEYGFIIRYPYGKEYYTGYGYEPWHIRYVGEKAQEITDSGLSLEEYYGLTSAYD